MAYEESGDEVVDAVVAGSGAPSGQGYWGAGGTLGPIITYGYLAGLAVASDLRSDRDLLEAVTR